MKKNYYLDWLLFISGSICFLTAILLDLHIISGGREVRRFYWAIHRYSGYLMLVGLIFHIAWHRKWIAVVTRSLLKSKSRDEDKTCPGSLPCSSAATSHSLADEGQAGRHGKEAD